MSGAPPIRIGMTSKLVGLGSTALAVAHAAHMRGAEFFYFKLEDVDPAAETIDGHVFRNGDWERQRTAFPDVVENDVMEELSGAAWDALVRKCRITTPFLGSKLDVDQAMRASGKFEEVLVPTARLDSADQLLDEARRHRRVVVKPATGTQGRGVFFVAKKGDGFFVNVEGKSKDLSADELKAFAAKHIAAESLIVQQYVASRTPHGQPYDVRIHVRRDYRANWQIGLINARIGSGISVAANLASGGSLANIRPFLKRQFAAASDAVYQRVIAVAQNFPPAFQSLYPGRTIPTLGIDIGLDEKGHPRLFEVNGNPSAQFAPFHDHMWRVGYALYLVENPDAPDGVIRS